MHSVKCSWDVQWDATPEAAHHLRDTVAVKASTPPRGRCESLRNDNISCWFAADYNVYVANTPGYTSFTVFPQPDTPLWADGTILYYGNLRGEWLQAENSGKVLAHEVT